MTMTASPRAAAERPSTLPPRSARATEPERLRFTVELFHGMGEAGIFHEDDHVELIEGDVIMMSPIGRRHSSCVDRLNRLLVRACGDDGTIRIQGPIILSDHTEPEPDVSVLKPREDDYADAHPRGPEVLLVVEVADSSLRFDQNVKLPIYARSGLAETWIVNLQDDVVEVHRRPGPEGYAERRVCGRGETIQLRAPQLEVAVDDILPRR